MIPIDDVVNMVCTEAAEANMEARIKASRERRFDMSEPLTPKEKEQCRAEALCIRGFDKWVADMDRDELLVLIGWLSLRIRKIECDVKEIIDSRRGIHSDAST